MCATYIKVVINYEQGGNINEKSRVLATTTLAGALLFTGLGNVDAAQTVNDSNIREYAQNTLGSHYTKSEQFQSVVVGQILSLKITV